MKPNGNPEPRIDILNGDYLFFRDDDISLSIFLRKVGPEILDLMMPLKLNLIELFGMLELWREQMAFVWAAHSPGRQQEGFEDSIRDVWNEVRVAQQRIYDRAVKELERRKAMS